MIKCLCWSWNRFPELPMAGGRPRVQLCMGEWVQVLYFQMCCGHGRAGRCSCMISFQLLCLPSPTLNFHQFSFNVSAWQVLFCKHSPSLSACAPDQQWAPCAALSLHIQQELQLRASWPLTPENGHCFHWVFYFSPDLFQSVQLFCFPDLGWVKWLGTELNYWGMICFIWVNWKLNLFLNNLIETPVTCFWRAKYVVCSVCG